MNRRLYYLFPDVGRCRSAVHELLLKRLSISHMHVVANESVKLGDLPEASLWQKSDIKHALVRGWCIGGLFGILVGVVITHYLMLEIGGFLIISAIVGGVFGAWAASMIGMTTPNTALESFSNDIERGKLLLIVDVPQHRVAEIEDLFRSHHPEARFSGVEPTSPPFP